MKKFANRIMLTACLVLPFAACKKHEEAPAEPADVALVAPATTEDGPWKVPEQGGRRQHGHDHQHALRLLPARGDRSGVRRQVRAPAGTGQGRRRPWREQRQSDRVRLAEQPNRRPGCGRVEGVETDAFKGVRVLFIGKPEDSERVKAAVAPSTAEYVFVEAK